MNRNSDELVIRITKDLKIKVEEIRDGITAYKEIEPSVLLDCIRGSVERERISSGLLPANCISYSVDNNGTRYIALRHPEMKIDFFYYNTHYKDFPIPFLVFGFVINKEGKISSTKLGVVKDEKLTVDSKMYHYPFSNVSGFNLCIGSNPMPVISSLVQLSTNTRYAIISPSH